MSRDTETQLDECKLLYRVNDVSLGHLLTLLTPEDLQLIYLVKCGSKRSQGCTGATNQFFLKKTHRHIGAQIEHECTEIINFQNRANTILVCSNCYLLISYYLRVKHNNQIFKKTANLTSHLHLSHHPVFHNLFIRRGFWQIRTIHQSIGYSPPNLLAIRHNLSSYQEATQTFKNKNCVHYMDNDLSDL